MRPGSNVLLDPEPAHYARTHPAFFAPSSWSAISFLSYLLAISKQKTHIVLEREKEGNKSNHLMANQDHWSDPSWAEQTAGVVR
jgi:hypothetical protein